MGLSDSEFFLDTLITNLSVLIASSVLNCAHFLPCDSERPLKFELLLSDPYRLAGLTAIQQERLEMAESASYHLSFH